MDTITELLTSANLDSGKIALAVIVLRVLGEAFSALKNGGGLVGLFRTICYGEGIPKAIAHDYHEELGGSVPKKEDPLV